MFRAIQSFVSTFMLMSLVFSMTVIGEPNCDPAQLPPSPEDANGKLTRTDYGKFPLTFEENRGQTRRAVKFVSRAPGYTAYLTATGATFSLKLPNQSAVENPKLRQKADKVPPAQKSDTLTMRFVGSNERPEIVGDEEVPTRTNYYIDKKRIENVSNFGRVTYHDMYKGIDAVFYGNASHQLEYDFVIAPNEDPAQIALDFDGATSITTDGEGNLVISTANSAMMQHGPIAYQTIDGVKRDVEVEYIVNDRQVTFTVGSYDPALPLVIDPALSYLTYIGGTAFDNAFDVTANANGNAYITGSTASLDFHGESRNDDDKSAAYATKINATGTGFEYITILEGNGDDSGLGIAVDAGGNAYLTGLASFYFPTTSGAYDTNHGVVNAEDAFVTKLNPTGGIVYSSFLGGADSDLGADIAVDSGGKAYVVGDTYSNTGFPKKNQYQGCGVVSPFGSFDSQDAFLTVFNPQGSDITYSSCIGNTVGMIGLSDEAAIGVALDSSNNAYVTGDTNSNNFKIKNAAQAEIGGGRDAWVAKFVPTQSGDASVAYATFLGGSGTDAGFGIAVTASGVASVTGITGSVNFPLQNAIDSTNQINEAFVSQYNSSGAKINSTFLGGVDQEAGFNIAVGNAGTVYVVGDTLSNDFPVATPFQASRRGLRDTFVTKIRFGINNNPGVSSSSYLGGNGNDKGFGIAVKGAFIFVVGETQSNNLLTTSGVIKAASAANSTNPDGFVAKILDSRKETIGAYDPINTEFDLRNTLNSGPADIIVNRGAAGDVGVAGDFNGDGIDTVSTFNNGVWKITNNNVIVSGYPAGPITANFGLAGDLPVVGDWDGDGIETIGTYRPSAGQFFLSNSITTPAINVQATFGIAEDLPVAGDWDGDGVDTVGVFRPSTGQFFLTNQNIAAPPIDFTTFFGTAGDLPVAGDWDGDGKDSIGVWRQSSQEFFLSNDNIAIADQFVFGSAGDTPAVGDWDGKPNQ
jgi:hypothetical protein